MKILNHQKAADKIWEITEKITGERGEFVSTDKEAAAMSIVNKWLIVAVILHRIIMPIPKKVILLFYSIHFI